MLFYLTNEEEIKLIPSSYLVLVLSNYNVKVSHPNIRKLDSLDLLPNNSDKKDYKEKLKRKKLAVAVLFNTVSKTGPSDSVVLYTTKKDIEKYQFNYLKTLCKYIENRYEYSFYKFTNNIDREMIEKSRMDVLGSYNLIEDLGKVDKKLQSQ